jgi:hypothetical protein
VSILSALLLCGGVVWFATHNLGAADQAASVLVGLTGLVWTIRHSRAEPGRTVHIRDSVVMSTGDHATNELTVHVDQRPSLWRRSKRRR